MTNVFIAAPTPMMRAGLRAMLDSADTHVVGETPSLADVGAPGRVLLQDVDVLVVARFAQVKSVFSTIELSPHQMRGIAGELNRVPFRGNRIGS